MNTIPAASRTRVDSIAGCLLGCAVGDAIGLPYEGMSTRRAQRFARLPLRHRFLVGHGMVSDDTDHTIFVAQALIRSGGDVRRFRAVLAWRLRLWLVCLPAGIGWATLRSTVRMWFGMSASGVFSAGNGPSMRSAVIGATFATDPEKLQSHIEASTRLTHTDPKALAGASAVAEVAAQLVSSAWSAKPSVDEFILAIGRVSVDDDWQGVVAMIRRACESANPVATATSLFATKQGVSGYVLHSVPFALIAWFQHFGDYRTTIECITQAGGDVDTVAAIAGALAGATVGPLGIPQEWLDDLMDWPHSISYLRALATTLTDPSVDAPTSFSPWLLPRGAIFTLLVLAHGVRRLLPPY